MQEISLANPALFLYRHSIELLLKAAMRETAKEHNLDQLADEFSVFVKSEFGADVPTWITARIKEFAKIDPRSTAFRYSETWDKTEKKYRAVDGEFFVDLRHLQRAMNALKVALSDVLYARKKP